MSLPDENLVVCQNCKYCEWETWECRRHPPVYLDRHTRGFPKVQAGDWCGDFANYYSGEKGVKPMVS